ncbi:MAG: DUF4258 domain-containing protein [Tannerella sp.]|nr:DUF4258 domain-containing protein [Tannerella sp.]
MDVIFSRHAEEQMLRRGILRETVMACVLQPNEIIISKYYEGKIR